MSATWLFYHFLKLEVHILHGLENISILIFGNYDLSDITSFSVKWASHENGLTDYSDIHIALQHLNALSYEINLFSCCSSPLSLIKDIQATVRNKEL